MKRLLGSNWQRIGLQVGLLAGIGLAFAMGTHQEPAEAGGMATCPEEGECTFKKPNIMFIMDYSTSMNEQWDMDNNLTRWEVTVAAVQQVTAPGSFLSQNTHLALTRFGHDPMAGSSGTTIPGDSSGLVDGQILDVPWDDENGEYYNCAGQTINDSLNATPAPMNGNLVGIGTWTKGALDFVSDEITATKDDHPEDFIDTPRAYVNVLLTDGAWTGVTGTMMPAGQNPSQTAGALYTGQGIRTYVVAVAGDAAAEAAADEMALAGGTTEAIYGGTPEELETALSGVVTSIIESVVAPECVGGLPRVMILLDGSSSMLNINNGTLAGQPGETGWDQAREALSGPTSLFDVDVGIGTVEDVSHLGLAVFGHDLPGAGEQKILVNYGPCMKDNFGWALDPTSSCEAPGCTDPWGGPAITWTFQDGTLEPPGFDQATISHMPRCDDGSNAYCTGSGTFTHLGLQLIKDNQVQYQADGLDPMAQYPTKPETIYFNILITDGRYDMYSSDAQVQAELQAMYGSGITTYVIGFGDGVDTPAAVAQLTSMAGWGSGGTEAYFDANNQGDLELALASIFGNLQFDPCCALNDCSENPEPSTLEPDPTPTPTTGDGDGDSGDGDGDPGDGDGDPGDGDGDPGDGDGDPGDGDGDPGDGDSGEGESGDEVGDEVGDDGDTGDTGDTGGGGIVTEDDGCNCSTTDSDADKTRGLLGAFLGLGLLGFLRRRRRD